MECQLTLQWNATDNCDTTNAVVAVPQHDSPYSSVVSFVGRWESCSPPGLSHGRPLSCLVYASYVCHHEADQGQSDIRNGLILTRMLVTRIPRLSLAVMRRSPTVDCTW